jgi:hypothetical protein
MALPTRDLRSDRRSQQRRLTMTAMTIATAASCLRECVDADIPAFLWGAPGIGKSQAIDQAAASLNMPVIDWRANLRDPVDVRGLPVVDIKTGVTRWLCPAELPVNGRHGPRGILKMDELNTASPAMMAACLQIVLERHAGEHKLDNGWVPVAAGNRMSDRAAVQRRRRLSGTGSPISRFSRMSRPGPNGHLAPASPR